MEDKQVLWICAINARRKQFQFPVKLADLRSSLTPPVSYDLFHNHVCRLLRAQPAADWADSELTKKSAFLYTQDRRRVDHMQEDDIENEFLHFDAIVAHGKAVAQKILIVLHSSIPPGVNVTYKFTMNFSTEPIIRGQQFEAPADGSDPIPSILGELVDNGIQACLTKKERLRRTEDGKVIKNEGHKIHIVLVADEQLDWKHIVVLDDGYGMSEVALHDALTYARQVPDESEAVLNHAKYKKLLYISGYLGKYGVGMKDAQFTLGSRIRLFSRTVEDRSSVVRMSACIADQLSGYSNDAQVIGSSFEMSPDFSVASLGEEGYVDTSEVSSVCDALISTHLLENRFSSGTAVLISQLRRENAHYGASNRMLQGSSSLVAKWAKLCDLARGYADSFASMYRYYILGGTSGELNFLAQCMYGPELLGAPKGIYPIDISVSIVAPGSCFSGDVQKFEDAENVPDTLTLRGSRFISKEFSCRTFIPAPDVTDFKDNQDLWCVHEIMGYILVFRYCPLKEGRETRDDIVKELGLTPPSAANKVAVATYWVGRLLRDVSLQTSLENTLQLKSFPARLFIQVFLSRAVRPHNHKKMLQTSLDLSNAPPEQIKSVQTLLKEWINQCHQRFDEEYALSGRVPVSECGSEARFAIWEISKRVAVFTEISLPPTQSQAMGFAKLQKGDKFLFSLKDKEGTAGAISVEVLCIWETFEDTKSVPNDTVGKSAADPLRTTDKNVNVDFRLVHDSPMISGVTFHVKLATLMSRKRLEHCDAQQLKKHMVSFSPNVVLGQLQLELIDDFVPVEAGSELEFSVRCKDTPILESSWLSSVFPKDRFSFLSKNQLAQAKANAVHVFLHVQEAAFTSKLVCNLASKTGVACTAVGEIVRRHGKSDISLIYRFRFARCPVVVDKYEPQFQVQFQDRPLSTASAKAKGSPKVCVIPAACASIELTCCFKDKSKKVLRYVAASAATAESSPVAPPSTTPKRSGGKKSARAELGPPQLDSIPETLQLHVGVAVTMSVVAKDMHDNVIPTASMQACQCDLRPADVLDVVFKAEISDAAAAALGAVQLVVNGTLPADNAAVFGDLSFPSVCSAARFPLQVLAGPVQLFDVSIPNTTTDDHDNIVLFDGMQISFLKLTPLDAFRNVTRMYARVDDGKKMVEEPCAVVLGHVPDPSSGASPSSGNVVGHIVLPHKKEPNAFVVRLANPVTLRWGVFEVRVQWPGWGPVTFHHIFEVRMPPGPRCMEVLLDHTAMSARLDSTRSLGDILDDRDEFSERDRIKPLVAELCAGHVIPAIRIRLLDGRKQLLDASILQQTTIHLHSPETAILVDGSRTERTGVLFTDDAVQKYLLTILNSYRGCIQHDTSGNPTLVKLPPQRVPAISVYVKIFYKGQEVLSETVMFFLSAGRPERLVLQVPEGFSYLKVDQDMDLDLSFVDGVDNPTTVVKGSPFDISTHKKLCVSVRNKGTSEKDVFEFVHFKLSPVLENGRSNRIKAFRLHVARVKFYDSSRGVAEILPGDVEVTVSLVTLDDVALKSAPLSLVLNPGNPHCLLVQNADEISDAFFWARDVIPRVVFCVADVDENPLAISGKQYLNFIANFVSASRLEGRTFVGTNMHYVNIGLEPKSALKTGKVHFSDPDDNSMFHENDILAKNASGSDLHAWRQLRPGIFELPSVPLWNIKQQKVVGCEGKEGFWVIGAVEGVGYAPHTYPLTVLPFLHPLDVTALSVSEVQPSSINTLKFDCHLTFAGRPSPQQLDQLEKELQQRVRDSLDAIHLDDDSVSLLCQSLSVSFKWHAKTRVSAMQTPTVPVQIDLSHITIDTEDSSSSWSMTLPATVYVDTHQLPPSTKIEVAVQFNDRRPKFEMFSVAHHEDYWRQLSREVGLKDWKKTGVVTFILPSLRRSSSTILAEAEAALSAPPTVVSEPVRVQPVTVQELSQQPRLNEIPQPTQATSAIDVRSQSVAVSQALSMVSSPLRISPRFDSPVKLIVDDNNRPAVTQQSEIEAADLPAAILPPEVAATHVEVDASVLESQIDVGSLRLSKLYSCSLPSVLHRCVALYFKKFEKNFQALTVQDYLQTVHHLEPDVASVFFELRLDLLPSQAAMQEVPMVFPLHHHLHPRLEGKSETLLTRLVAFIRQKHPQLSRDPNDCLQQLIAPLSRNVCVVQNASDATRYMELYREHCKVHGYSSLLPVLLYPLDADVPEEQVVCHVVRQSGTGLDIREKKKSRRSVLFQAEVEDTFEEPSMEPRAKRARL